MIQKWRDSHKELVTERVSERESLYVKDILARAVVVAQFAER